MREEERIVFPMVHLCRGAVAETSADICGPLEVDAAGRRTDGICNPAKAAELKALREYLAEDYAELPRLLADLGQFVPPRLLTRTTACD